MDSRKLVLLAGALVIAVITALMARNLVAGSPAPSANAIPASAQPANTTEVLVATRELPIGTILDAEALKFVAWPKDLVEGAYFVKGESDPAKLQGTVVRFAIPAGQPVTQGALVKPGDRGFLAAALGPGMRAVTVPVSAQTSVAGFVFPGDRVDLLLTQSVQGVSDGPALKTAETVLRNLRVLATDQRTDKQTDDKGNTVVNAYSTVTLEATPRIAEKISVALTVGSISLSLRSIADNRGDLEQAIANGEIEVPSDPKQEKAMLARIAAAPSDGPSTYVTGADVSRFQRSSVPPATAPAPAAGTGAPMMAQPGAPAAAPVRQGPVVTIVRGNAESTVTVGNN